MTLRERWSPTLRLLAWLGHNKITATGAIITTSAGLTIVGFWLLETLQLRAVHPYAGIILFLILPAVFAFGLALMPIGALYARRRARLTGKPNDPPAMGWSSLRPGIALAVVATVANVIILSTASYKGVEHMDSVSFCGEACHSVMAPEYTAFLGSPHARVGCAACHIGPGATGFVTAKLSGTRQLFKVAFGTYARPIPSPVRRMRPARETCEQCHWPQKRHGNKLVVHTKFQDDETNTRLTTVLMLNVGGGDGSGIHGHHLNEAQPVSYTAIDAQRQVIPLVSHVDAKGATVEFVSSEIKTTPDLLAHGERRVMDCMDCHNRPSHTFELPEHAVDKAMADGSIDPSLPFVKKKTVELLRADYPDADTAAGRITAGMAEFYRSKYPAVWAEHRTLVERAATRAVAIYSTNVFPTMKIGWGTYPNDIGHDDSLGCFRCHDDKHKSRDDKAITQECSVCHNVLAMDEANPKLLSDLGIQ